MTNIILMIFSLISFPSKEVDENNFKYIDTQIKVNVSEFKEKKELYEKKNYFNGESKEEIANKLNRYLKDSVIEEFINSYDEIMDGVYEGDLISNSKANKISLFLRSISKEYVYTNEKIVANEIVGYNIIHNLLDIFVPAALNKEVKPYKGYDGKLYSLISKNYRFVCENNIEQKECSEEYSRLLLVTDFICGMTDSYAAYLYEELNGMKA